ncbi:MAG: PQQ-binding-like beta-propeller repeat protein [Pirellulaceae bacterium]
MLIVASLALFAPAGLFAGEGDWVFWRGPHLNGTADATGLPESWSPKGENLIWKRDDCGTRSTPIVMNGRLYTVCRANPETTEEGERVICLDALTGETIWETFNNVYLSDAPAERVGWSSVVGDPASNQVYVLGLGCLFQCLNAETGEVVWSRSLSEELGMLSTYGGRTNFPVVFENLVIISGVTTGWDAESLPAYRLIAFDKMTGQPLWLTSTRPRPEDTTYSTPILTKFGDQDALVVGAGDGSVYAIQPRTGAVIWKYEVSIRGINQTPLIVGDRVYCGHSEKNIADTTVLGAFFCIDGMSSGDISEDAVIWKNAGETIGRSAPLYIDGRVYAVDDGGTMLIFDAETGEEVGRQRLGRIMFGSPLYADGKIYVGEATGRFYVLAPTDKGVEVLSQTRLTNEEILGSPICAMGRIYLPTVGGIYCIGTDAGAAVTPRIQIRPENDQPLGAATQLRVAPARDLVYPGQAVELRVDAFDALGRPAGGVDYQVSIEGPATFENGRVVIGADGANQVVKVNLQAGEATGSCSFRVVPPLPWRYEFTDGVLPPTWVGVAYRHRPFTIDGEPCLVKVSTIPKGTRSQSWLGPYDLHDYTIQADFLATRADDRLPDMGLINSRYTLVMLGTQELQVRSWVSRLEMRFAKTQPFEWQEGVWYRMKFRSDVEADRIVLRGKVWPRDEQEPAEWTIEAADLVPNVNGSPGIHGQSSPAEFYLDNIVVEPNN